MIDGMLLSVYLMICNTLHKFWDQSSSRHYQCCLQASERGSWHKLQCCYPSNMLQHWTGGRCLISFCKVDHSPISINFSKNWLSLNNLRVILQFWVSLHEFDRKSFGSELASSITLILQANWRTPNVLVTPKFCDISKVLKTDLSQLKSTQDDLVFNFSTKITSKACYRRIAVETRFQTWSIYRFLLNCSLNCLLKCLHPVQLRK